MTQSINRTVPIFPCRSLEEVMIFYEAIGFKVTYLQTAPYGYLALKHDIAEISFYRAKKYDKNNQMYQVQVYIFVDDVEAVYEEFITNFKNTYGKLYRTGLPRISQLNTTKEDRRFTLADPAGSVITIAQPLENKKTEELQRQQYESDPNERLYYLVYALAYSKLEYRTAYNALQRLLKNEIDLSKILRAKALIMKADLEVLNEDYEAARDTLNQIETIKLHQQIYKNLTEEKQRLSEVKSQLEEL